MPTILHNPRLVLELIRCIFMQNPAVVYSNLMIVFPVNYEHGTLNILNSTYIWENIKASKDSGRGQHANTRQNSGMKNYCGNWPVMQSKIKIN